MRLEVEQWWKETSIRQPCIRISKLVKERVDQCIKLICQDHKSFNKNKIRRTSDFARKVREVAKILTAPQRRLGEY